MKLETRVFICFVLILVFVLCCGCHSTKHEWFPKDKPELTQEEKETGAIKGNVLKLSF